MTRLLPLLLFLFTLLFPGGSLQSASLPTGAGERVLNGVDVLKRERFARLRGLKVGLITNHTGTDNERNPTIDLLFRAPEVRLVALFSPEHGLRGQLDDKVGDSTDSITGLPVYSLYGARRAPSAEQLRQVDVLVFDIQDIGCRFYTYISTLGYGMEAAGRAKIKFMVLDRVNPITGDKVEGPMYAGLPTFTAYHSLPVRHGMTVGELARLFNAERGLAADLVVVPVEGWNRSQWYDQTGLPWINPSPNMRNLSQAMFYPGIGLQETALSVGRGTDTPFEVVGAPYINDRILAAELNRAGLPGIRFVSIRFTPKASTFKDQECGGVYLLLLDRQRCPVVEVGVLIATTLHRLYPNDYALQKLQTLLQHLPTLEAIRSGKSVSEIAALWDQELVAFRKRREPFLLYP